MISPLASRRLTRRKFLRIGAGALAAVTIGGLMADGHKASARGLADPTGLVFSPARTSGSATSGRVLRMAATDGWASLPGAIPHFHPDPYAPAGLSTYIFGFRDVTGMTAAQVSAQKGRAQVSAPMWWIDEGTDNEVSLTNLGLSQRPDLADSVTINFHGFRDSLPIVADVPETSYAVPGGSSFTYFYRPRDPGTYMWLCQFEAMEHVQMGLAGIVFVLPAQNQAPLHPGEKYCYNDGNGSTRYDREFGMFLSELWAQAHFDAAHIVKSDWSEYHADFSLLNGRGYPDTLAPNGGGPDAGGDLVAPAGHAELKYQPISSLVTCNAGDRVLLRFANLGYEQHAMTLDGFPLQVVGKDATLLRGRDGADQSYWTNTIAVGPGESIDAIFTAPKRLGSGPYDTYPLYDRRLMFLGTPGVTGLGGAATEIRVYPAGTLPPQSGPQM